MFKSKLLKLIAFFIIPVGVVLFGVIGCLLLNIQIDGQPMWYYICNLYMDNALVRAIAQFLDDYSGFFSVLLGIIFILGYLVILPVAAAFLILRTLIVTLNKCRIVCMMKSYDYSSAYAFQHKHTHEMNGAEWKEYHEKKKKERRERFQRAYEKTMEDMNREKYQQEQYEYNERSYQQTNQENTEYDELHDALKAFFFNTVDDITMDELKRRRNKLIKDFRSDNGEANVEISQKINAYFALLKNYAKK